MKSAIAAVMAVLLTGCATSTGWMYTVPNEPAFNPAPQVQGVRVKLIKVEDPSATCRAMYPTTLGGYRIMLACAGWSPDRSECTIVTGMKPLPEVIGHELRHCFEGNFHP
jgi:hypothetical protein